MGCVASGGDPYTLHYLSTAPSGAAAAAAAARAAASATPEGEGHRLNKARSVSMASLAVSTRKVSPGPAQASHGHAYGPGSALTAAMRSPSLSMPHGFSGGGLHHTQSFHGSPSGGGGGGGGGTGAGGGGGGGGASPTNASKNFRSASQRVVPDSTPKRSSSFSVPTRRAGDTEMLGDHLDITDFDLGVIIGRGGYAWVRVAQHTPTGRFVVLKSIKKARAQAKNSVQDLQDEKRVAVAMTEMNHPFLVKCFGSFQDTSHVYFAFEFIQGGELFGRLRKVRRMSNDAAKFYAAEVLLAIEALHARGFAYRDLKPENIMISADGHVKLIDFGFSCPASAVQRLYRRVGTANYLAPEMLDKDVKQVGYNRCVDWWAFGCLLYELLTGKSAFGKPHDPSHGIYLSIIKNTLTIPPYVNAAARSLLRGLLCTDLTKRIVDVNAIRAHEWFKEVDWVAMYQCRAVPPYTPPVTGPEDVQHFDTYSKSDNGDEGTVDKWSNVKRNSPSRSALPASSFADFSGL